MTFSRKTTLESDVSVIISNVMMLQLIGSHGEHYGSVHHWVAEARRYVLIYSTWDAEVSHGAESYTTCVKLRTTLPGYWVAVNLQT
jgi:hypothetical protein